MSEPRILREATFNRKVRSYWLLSGTLVCIFTVVGIVVLPFWLLLGHYLTERYLERISCTLTEKSLKLERGILVRRETTVPLDKITDVGLVEGPVMRLMDLQAIKIETAGQSATGAAIQIVGIENTRGFRDAVLDQRDRVVDRISSRGSGASPGPALAEVSGRETGGASVGEGEGTGALLTEIRDLLARIESRV